MVESDLVSNDGLRVGSDDNDHIGVPVQYCRRYQLGMPAIGGLVSRLAERLSLCSLQRLHS